MFIDLIIEVAARYSSSWTEKSATMKKKKKNNMGNQKITVKNRIIVHGQAQLNPLRVDSAVLFFNLVVAIQF